MTNGFCSLERWNDDAALLEPIVSASFPSILNTGRNLLDAPNASSPEVGELIYVILKAYKTSMTSQLTAHQQSNDSIVPWGTFMLNVVQKQVDASSMPADAESRETCSWWKAKKWAYFSLNKLFSRCVYLTLICVTDAFLQGALIQIQQLRQPISIAL